MCTDVTGRCVCTPAHRAAANADVTRVRPLLPGGRHMSWEEEGPHRDRPLRTRPGVTPAALQAAHSAPAPLSHSPPAAAQGSFVRLSRVFAFLRRRGPCTPRAPPQADGDGPGSAAPVMDPLGAGRQSGLRGAFSAIAICSEGAAAAVSRCHVRSLPPSSWAGSSNGCWAQPSIGPAPPRGDGGQLLAQLLPAPLRGC